MNKKPKYMIGTSILIVSIVSILVVYSYMNSSEPLDEMEKKLAHTKKLLEIPIGGVTDHIIILQPGETEGVSYTFYTRDKGPGEISYEIYRVTAVYETEEISMLKGVNISITPSTFFAEPQNEYTSKIAMTADFDLEPGMYTFYVNARFGGVPETRGEDWIRVAAGTMVPPGFGGFYRSYSELDKNSVTLEPGETKEIYYTIHTGENSPMMTHYEIIGTTKDADEVSMKEEKRVPVPEGLTVTVESNNFLARPHEEYASKITIHVSPQLAPGVYLLLVSGPEYCRIKNPYITIIVES